jgi:hypothetical protein
MNTELLTRFKLTAEEWADMPAVLQGRMQRRLEAERAKAEAKRAEESAKFSRRIHREIDRREKQPDQVALCGIRYYSCSPRDRARGSFWRTCVGCGKPLQYHNSYEEADRNRHECRRD